ncbi:MAG TPA: hypothetical protein ENI32_06255 [Candidatus Syntrophoarchaeum butanivorans]|uniref:Uncharacterized protein n=1 Tax=Candidatus Syntropharchaeum butanivorans TaxID=1839936 RepID=A0A7J2S1Y1_9EURY|nr:hypothetical protein [Candidatus Syntrophoarchaeum butanivorans]
MDKKRQIEDIMDKTRKEQVVIIFEDLFSAWIEDIKSLGMIELYKRKIGALASPGSIYYSFI